MEGELETGERTVNAPVPRRDARAPAVVLLGLAGVAGLAWWMRRRREAVPAGVAGGARAAAALVLAGTILGGKALGARALSGGASGVGALVVRRSGVSRLIRHAPLIRAGVRWFAHPRPLSPRSEQASAALDRIVGLAPLLAGRDRREQVRFAAGLLAGASLVIPLARKAAGPAPAEEAATGAATSANADAINGAGRRLSAAAVLLGIAVLADSGLEHYRACFENPAMYLPLVASGLLIVVNLGGGAGGAVAGAVHLGSAAVGLLGLGFHFYNIGKRPGGYDWLNFFYGAPFGAPAALVLAALIGHAAGGLDPARPVAAQTLAGLPFAPAMAVVVGAGIAGTVAEVALLHFRGAFHNPAMWLPLSVPPVAAVLMAGAAFVPDASHAATRAWLWGTAVLGIGGVAFHAYGVSRNMGGWYNWSQNILAGPPLPAPPSFSALAIAGLGVLDLIEAGR